MSSFFSIFSNDNDETTSQAADEVVPAAAPVTAAAHNTRLEMEARNNAATLDKALENLRLVLNGFLSILPTSEPAHTVSVTGVTERALGLGNRRGMERRGVFDVVALKGGRLDVMVAFVLWADDLTAVEDIMNTLQGDLLAASADLWAAGILRIEAEEAAPADFVGGINAWRKTAVYRILYEFHFEDSDGSDSLIARIPIDIATDSDDEATVVTNEMVRWDNGTAPTLSVRGRFTIGRLSLLAFVPGNNPTNKVTLIRTFDGATDPMIFTTLPDFITAVTHPTAPARNAQITFETLTELLAALAPDGNPITLGDWDTNGIPDDYQAYLLYFTPPLRLLTFAERLELSVQGSSLNQVAVVYAQVKR